MGLSGEYRFVVRDAATHAVKRETDWMKNLITDAGLNRLGTGGWFGYCHIGTGSTTPAFGDTGLAVPAATTASLQSSFTSNSGSPLYETTTTIVYRFNAGALNGNYTEVGISWGGGTLFSRALIVDGGGSPTTITVASTEYLDVYYRLTVVPDLSDSSYGVTIGGVGYTVTRRASSVSYTPSWTPSNTVWLPATASGATVTAYSGNAGAVTGSPSGDYANFFTGATIATYSNNSLINTGTLNFGLGDLNVSGGIKTLLVYNSVGAWQHQFDVAIPKDPTKIMSLTFTLSWARV